MTEEKKSWLDDLKSNWKFYSFIIAGLLAFNTLYIRHMISEGIRNETGQAAPVTALSKDLAVTATKVEDIDANLKSVSEDVKQNGRDINEVLKMMVTE